MCSDPTDPTRRPAGCPLHCIAACVGALLLTAPGLAQTLSARAAPTYQVIDVGTLGGPGGNALDVAAGGLVVGSADTAAGVRHAFVALGGRTLDLNGAGSASIGEAWGTDGAGLFVGFQARPPALLHRATRWSAEGALDLGTLGGPGSEAFAVNAKGIVVGQADTSATGNPHAFLWDGAMHDLGTLGGSRSIAWDVNDSNQVVGSAYLDRPQEHAVLWQVRKADLGAAPSISSLVISTLDLGTLGGGHSAAFGIDAAGRVVGWSQTAAGTFRAFLSTLDDVGGGRTMVALEHPAGAVSSKALDLNERGEIVGSVLLEPGGPGSAYHWDELGRAVDLNARIAPEGWHLIQANAIGPTGVIVGYGLRGGAYRAFALVPLDPAPTIGPALPRIGSAGEPVSAAPPLAAAGRPDA